MDTETMRDLVGTARVGRLATVRADGRPHLVPVCFVLLGETVYTAVDGKPKRHDRLTRIANLAATGVASLLVDRYREDWTRLWWVRLDGTGRVVDEPAETGRAVDGLVGKYSQYAAGPPAGPVLAIDVARWVGWSARGGDLGR